MKEFIQPLVMESLSRRIMKIFMFLNFKYI
ncbi:hypothetical protein DN34_2388 [Vibrio cholerae]|nr:hypothetical protein DN34_2388 [Vibrio cholerae]